MVKTSLSLAAAIAVIGLATNAFAVMQQQGINPNGVSLQGMETQGWSLNGANLQGIETKADAMQSPQSLLTVESVILPTGETVDLR